MSQSESSPIDKHALATKMRKQAQGVYLACEESVAADIAGSLNKAADLLSPICIGHGGNETADEDGFGHAIDLDDEDDARRAAACLKACAGIPLDMLENNAFLQGAAAFAKERDDLKRELAEANERSAPSRARNTTS